MRWAFSSETAACTACSIASSAAPLGLARRRRLAVARPRRGGRAGAGACGRGAELRAEVLEDLLVEAVLALQVGLDHLQELAGLGALDDAMVVGRRHRHHLLGADRRADVAEAGRVADRAGGDDRALAGHQPRDGGDRADAARVGERDVGALEVVGGELVLARLGDQLVERVEELREGEPAGVADHRHHQRAPAVLLLDVDGDAEVDLAVVDDVRLAVDLGERARHHRHLLGGGAGDRVGDQVGEGDLLAGLLELLAAAVERGDGDRAERGRGRDRARLVHVAREHRAGALEQRARPRACRWSPAVGRGGAAVGGGQHVGLGDAPGGAAALDRAEVDAVGGGDAGGDRRDLRAVGHRRRVAGGARGGGRLAAPAWRPLGGRAPARHAGDHLADLDRLARLGEDLGERAGGGRGHLGVDLVGGDLDDRLVVLDAVADLLGPLEDRALGDRLAHRGHRDVDRPSASAGGSARRSASRLGRRARRGAAPLVGAISARTLPTSTVSPSAAWIFTTVPDGGAGTSASTLSVEISTSVSSSATSSPSCLCHSRMVPSETDSPIAGMTTSTVVLTAMSRLRPYRVRAAIPACVDGVLARRIRRCPRTARGRPPRRPSSRATAG